MEKFLEFLYSWEPAEPAELRHDLEAYGADVGRIEHEVNAIVSKARKARQARWLGRAREKQGRFDELLRSSAANVAQGFENTKELIDAIFAGKLGVGVQARAAVFFRNKSGAEISEKDLRSFIEDCKLLELL